MLFFAAICLFFVGIGIIVYNRKFNTYVEQRLNALGAMLIVPGVLLMLLSAVRIIPAGTVGVIDIFGNVSERVLPSGVSFVYPFAKIVPFSIKTQEVKEEMEVPSKEGLTVLLDASVLYKLVPDSAAFVYSTVGSNYQSIVLYPQFRSVARGVTVNYEVKALYTSNREMIAKQIQEELQKSVRSRGIVVENVLLRSMTLPTTISKAIEQKLKAEQESEQMKFILEKEKQEAERKQVEAEGIKTFQQIVTEGITPGLLKWKGIEATEKLGKSTNSKIIIIGNPEDGLPLVFGAGEGTK